MKIQEIKGQERHQRQETVMEIKKETGKGEDKTGERKHRKEALRKINEN